MNLIHCTGSWNTGTILDFLLASIVLQMLHRSNNFQQNACSSSPAVRRQKERAHTGSQLDAERSP